MHALVSPDLSTSFVPIVSWYFNARTRCGGRLFEQFRAGARTVYAHPRVDGFAQARVHTGGRFGVPSTAVLKVAGSAELGRFRPGDFIGDDIRRCRAEPGLGPVPVRITPPAALVAHPPSQLASHAKHGRREPI